MPMVGRSSQGQVLNLRYVIEQQISEDNNGCTYKAEDVVDNKIVLIKALPLSVPLDSSQIKQLKEYVNIGISIPAQNINIPESFDVHGQVRYFVHEYSEQQKPVSSNIIEKIKIETDSKLAAEFAAKAKIEAELENYKNKFQQLEGEAKAEKHNYDELLSQLNNQIETQKASYEQTIQQVETKITQQETIFSNALVDANTKIKSLLQEKEIAINLVKEREEQLERLILDIEKQQTAYENSIKKLEATTTEKETMLSEALSKANRNNAVLAQEKNNALNLIEEHEKQLAQLNADFNARLSDHEQITEKLKSQVVQLEIKLSEASSHAAEKIEALSKEKQNAINISTEQLEQIEQLNIDLGEQQQKFNLLLKNSEQLLDDAKQKIQSEILEKAQIEQQYQAGQQEIRQLEEKKSEREIEFAAILDQLQKNLDIETDAKKQAEQQNAANNQAIEELNAKISQQEGKFTSKLNEIKLKLQAEMQSKEAFQSQNATYKETIEQFETLLADEQKQHAKALWKIEALSAALNQANIHIEKLLEEKNKVLQQNKENLETLDKLQSQEEYQPDYASQLDKAQWKIKALSAELEKLVQKKEEIGIASSPASKNKTPVMAFVLIFVSALLSGTGLSYFYLNYKKTELPISNQITVSADLTKTAIDTTEPVKEKTLLSEPVQKIQEQNKPLLSVKSDVDYQQEIAKLKNEADANNSDAIFKLGFIYYSGQLVEKDYAKAFDFFVKSAQAGNTMAMYNAGKMYQEGNGINADPNQAVDWYKKAAKGKLTKAMNQLAQMYYFGDTVEQNYQKAAEYYQLSATHDDVKAMYNLAILYQTGVGVEKDIKKSMLWFIKAARAGDPDSMYKLAVMFDEGVEVEKDAIKADYWYNAAAKAGQEQAKKHLEFLTKES